MTAPKTQNLCFDVYYLYFTTLQPMIKAKLSLQRIGHCHKVGLGKTILMIPRNIFVSFKSTCLNYSLSRLTLEREKGSWLETCTSVVGYHRNRLDETVLRAVPKPWLTELGIHYRFEICKIVACFIYVAFRTWCAGMSTSSILSW